MGGGLWGGLQVDYLPCDRRVVSGNLLLIVCLQAPRPPLVAVCLCVAQVPCEELDQGVGRGAGRGAGQGWAVVGWGALLRRRQWALEKTQQGTGV